MMEMTEQTDFENKKLNETMDEEIDDTEEGEILEDGEIADEEDINDKKDDIKVEEKENNNNRDKESINKDRDSRRKEDSSRKSDENKSRDKDRDRNRDRERDKERDRRHVYERTDRSDRDRKSADRDRKSSNDDDRDKRRRDRDRKRRRSEEEEERDKRKRSRDQNWDYNESNNSRTNFDDYDRRFEEMDFRLNDPSFTNSNALHHSSEDEDFNFDERDFEEMLQIMEHRMPTNRTDAMPSTEKRAMMRAMAIMMKRNLDSDMTRRLARLKEKRRTRDRTPGPTGTRATPRQTERTDRTQTDRNFKPLCKFFVEGKCHKGSDCSYSHETSPSKKKEICKFYLQGFCGKGEECLFMHNEFPCKFFHTNVECYSGDNCRFSHSPLTDETRQILRNYLDSGQLPDDPKPDKNEMQSKNESIKTEENNANNSNNNNNNTNNSQTNTNTTPSSSTYTPMKPVAKRHAILGDATKEMKTSYYTWVWQQEMKELEVAYVGNKRNLFCVESKFAITEKPPTPRMEDDEEEIEAQIRSYYMETMGNNFENEETEVSNKVTKSEEQILIEASAHDEDLRTITMRPRKSANESIDNKSIIKSEEQENQLIGDSPVSQSKSQSNEVPTNLPKVARDLYMKMQNKIQTESESKSSWLSDSDDDDKDEHVLAAALKNVQQQKSDTKSSSVDKSKRTIDISKMLSAIRQSSNTTPANTSTKQSEFWQNILSGINLAGSSPSGNTPPRNDYRDPRLKRSKDKDIMSPLDTTPPVKICDPNVIIEYKLLPLTPTDIDYSCYVSIYRIDSRLKNDPRLQKFFAKLPTSEIDNLSRIVPPPLKTAPVTPLSVLKSKKKSEKEKRDKKVKPNSPTLPPLPPLTISPSKSAPTPGIIPPTPPPIMSPLELISSRPTFTVGENKSSNNTKEMNANVVMKEEKIDLKSPQSASSPESSTQSEDNQKQSKSDPKRSPTFLPPNLNESVTIAANPLPPITIDIKPQLSSSPPQPSTPLSSTSLNTELYETSFDTSLTNTETENDEQNPNDQKEVTNNGSTDDDLYDNLYVPITDLSKTGPQYSVSSSSSLIEDELEMIRNELQAPVIDSDNEMEIDIRERQDSVSEVESADECELTIASSSETEDNNIDNDLNNRNSVINDNNNAINLMQSNNQLNDEPINLTLSDVQNNEISDQSLKSVFSTIDPTASPFC